MPPPNDEQARLLREQRRQEDAAARHLISLLRAAREEVRGRIGAGAAPASAALLRQIEASITESLERVRAQMTLAIGAETLEAATLGATLVDAGLEGVLLAQFALDPDLLQAVSTYHAGLVQDLTDELRGRVSEIIGRSVLAGTPTETVVRELGLAGVKPLGPFLTAETRAEVIARTELNRVANMGTDARLRQAAADVPGLRKEWLTAGDERVRESHRAANGQIVGVEEMFTVGGFKCRFPVDPSLPASQSVNCRCRALPVVPED